MMRVWRLTDVCLSVAYIGPKSRTERPRKTKIGTEVTDVTWLGHHFQGQKVKGQLAGAGAYCGGLPHSFLVTHCSTPQWRKIPLAIFLYPHRDPMTDQLPLVAHSTPPRNFIEIRRQLRFLETDRQTDKDHFPSKISNEEVSIIKSHIAQQSW